MVSFSPPTRAQHVSQAARAGNGSMLSLWALKTVRGDAVVDQPCTGYKTSTTSYESQRLLLYFLLEVEKMTILKQEVIHAGAVPCISFTEW